MDPQKEWGQRADVFLNNVEGAYTLLCHCFLAEVGMKIQEKKKKKAQNNLWIRGVVSEIIVFFQFMQADQLDRP